MKKILTAFCFTDIHNQQSMLDYPTTLRKSLVAAKELAVDEFGLADVALIGGDNVSDYPYWNRSCALPKKNFLDIKAKLHGCASSCARDGKVLYVAGNNDMILGDIATKENEQGAKASIYFFNTNENTGNCYVFETKIKVAFDENTASACAGNATPLVAHFQISSATPNGGSASGSDTGVASSGFARIYAKLGDDGKLHYYMNHTNYATDANILNADAEITEGWHTFTAEMYENGWVKTYVDGVLVGTSKCISNADLNGTNSNGFKFSDANSVKVQIGNSSIGGDIDNSAIYFDNTFLGKVDKAYVTE